MFSDFELLDILRRIMIGNRELDSGIVEYKAWTDKETQDLALDEIVTFIKAKLK